MEGAQWPVKAAIDFSLHCHQRLFPQLKLVCGIRSLPVAQREADLLLLQATGRLPGMRVQATLQVHMRRQAAHLYCQSTLWSDSIKENGHFPNLQPLVRCPGV